MLRAVCMLHAVRPGELIIIAHQAPAEHGVAASSRVGARRVLLVEVHVVTLGVGTKGAVIFGTNHTLVVVKPQTRPARRYPILFACHMNHAAVCNEERQHIT